MKPAKRDNPAIDNELSKRKTMNKKEEYVMVGIGEILWDMLPEGRQLGGAPANFAYHARQLGNRGIVVSSVGNDEEGADILRRLEQKNVEHIVTTSEEYATGTVSIEMGKGGLPSYTIHEDVAWDHLLLDSRHFDLAAKADVVCFGTLAQRSRDSAEAIRDFLSRTADTCIRLFDVNFRQKYYDQETVLRLLQFATILKLNDEELLVVKDFLKIAGEETETLMELSTAFDLDLIILTKGQEGSRLYSRRLGDSSFKADPVEVADTVGAGDSFAAAVATGVCRNLPLVEIHPLAEKVASYVCRHAGATPELPPLDEFI